MTAIGGSRGGLPGPAWRVVLTPWLLSRVLVLAAAVAVAARPGALPLSGSAPDAAGIWAWDAGWYRAIAESGYDGHSEGERVLRFFPLLPMLGRLFGPLLGGVESALLAVSWVSAFAYGLLIVRLMRLEVGEEAAAARACWLTMLVPGAAVLVLAYAEPLAGALSAAFFLALRTRRPWVAAAVGIAAGLARPTALLLAVPALIEAVRWVRAERSTARLAAAARWVVAVLAVPLGTALYCAWVGLRYGNPLLPYAVQASPELRGGFAVSPFSYLVNRSPEALPWFLQTTLLLAALVLVVVAFLRFPASYGTWAALVLVASITSAHGGSLPRYIASAFPLSMALATWVKGWSLYVTMALAVPLFVYLALVGLTPAYIP